MEETQYTIGDVEFRGQMKAIILEDADHGLSVFLSICNILLLNDTMKLESGNTILHSVLFKKFVDTVPPEIKTTAAATMDYLNAEACSKIFDILNVPFDNRRLDEDISQEGSLSLELGSEDQNSTRLPPLFDQIAEGQLGVFSIKNRFTILTKNKGSIYFLFAKKQNQNNVTWMQYGKSAVPEKIIAEEAVGPAEPQPIEGAVAAELPVGQALVAGPPEEEAGKFNVRRVQFLGQIRHVLLQNADDVSYETSLLLSISNALALKGELNFGGASKYEAWEVQSELLNIVDTWLDFQQLAGYKAEPILGSVDAFIEAENNGDSCLEIFRMLKVPLYHGFVNENEGLEQCLAAKIGVHDIAVLLHEEKFFAATKHGERIYLLITKFEEDENIIWEGLDNGVCKMGDFELQALEEAELADAEDAASNDSGSDGSTTAHVGDGEHLLSPTGVLSIKSNSTSSSSFEEV